jgi:hypothetical protein
MNPSFQEPAMARHFPLIALLAALLLAGTCGTGSCVQFDGQSILVRHDAARDRLDVLLIYRDLHTTGDPAQGLEQLEAIRAGQRTFALGSNFPLLFRLDEMTEDQRDPSRPATCALLDALVARTTMRNGALWQDAQGRVCGSQLVRLEGAAQTVRDVNRALHESLSRPGELERFAADWHLSDAESLARLHEAAAGHFTFAGLRGSALWFALPLSDAGFVSLKHELFDEWEQAVAGRASGSKATAEQTQARAILDALALNEWSIERSAGFVTFVLGAPHAATVELTVPPVGRAAPGVPDVLARRALIDALRPRGWTIGGSDAETAARAAYEAFTHEP